MPVKRYLIIKAKRLLHINEFAELRFKTPIQFNRPTSLSLRPSGTATA